jgi:UDPglucose 6-dehydrogenase
MDSKIKIGIIGNGFCGQATEMFSCSNNICKFYDIIPDKCSDGISLLSDFKDYDFIMICVNTPMIKETGQCYTGLVETCIKQIREFIDTNITTIIVRSTVPINFCKENNVVFMPEFLTEANWKNDVLNCSNWFIGVNDLSDNILINKIDKIFQNRFPDTQRTYIKSEEAESIKYFRNCFLATKISFCNEFFTLCNALNINYETVRKYSTLDNRIGTSHTLVPGPDGYTGFSKSCFPKDTAALLYQFNILNVESTVLKGTIDRNNRIDRPEQDWLLDKGRSAI